MVNPSGEAAASPANNATPASAPTSAAAFTSASNATRTTPAWVIRAISVVLVLISPVLAHWNLFSKNPTGAQAAILLACVVLAGLIFTIQVGLAAVHEYGFTRAALGEVVTDEQKEMKVLWPDMRSFWSKAEPVVNQTVPELSNDLKTVKAQVAALSPPPADAG